MPPKSAQTSAHPLRILIAADGQGGATHAGAFQKAFESEGHTTAYFEWKDYFHNYQYAANYPTDSHTRWGRLKSIYYRAQNKLTFGPAVCRLNYDLLQQAKTFHPDLIFIYRGTHVWPATLRRLKKATGAAIYGYNNDDPFSPVYPAYFWRHFRRGIPFYDHLFAYRQKNIEDYANTGYTRTSLLRSYYLKHANTRITPKPTKNPYACDVTFIGHYEPDGRDETLLHLLKHGINLKLFGTLWENSPHYAALQKHMGGPIKALYGADYNLALNSAKIALVFLSKLNNDTYTRRCFEIPATGTLMASEYTQDQAESLYAPDKEAIYFTDKHDLLAKLTPLLTNPTKLQVLALAGHQRLLAEGHEVTDRARQILATYHANTKGHAA